MFYHNKIQLQGIQNINIDTKLNVSAGGKISFGKKTNTYNNVHFSAIGGNLKIGDNVSFNRNCITVCRDSITIGDKCMFGPNVCIYDHDHNFNSDGIQNGFKTKPIIIENNCWIGANVVILRGTHIGDKCVIGAGTVLQGYIPPHSIIKSNRTIEVQPIEKQA